MKNRTLVTIAALSLALVSTSAFAQVAEQSPKLDFSFAFSDYHGGWNGHHISLNIDPAGLQTELLKQAKSGNIGPTLMFNRTFALLNMLPMLPDFADMLRQNDVKNIKMYVGHFQGVSSFGDNHSDTVIVYLYDSEGSGVSCLLLNKNVPNSETLTSDQWKTEISTEAFAPGVQKCLNEAPAELKKAKKKHQEEVAEAAWLLAQKQAKEKAAADEAARVFVQNQAKEKAAAEKLAHDMEFVNQANHLVDSLVTARSQKDLKPAADSASASKSSAPVTQPE